MESAKVRNSRFWVGAISLDHYVVLPVKQFGIYLFFFVDATIFPVACVINVATGILYYCFHALSFLFNRIGTRL